MEMRPQGSRVAPPLKVALFVISILPAGVLVSVGNAQQLQTRTKAVQLTGLIGVKNNTEGSLTIENGNLHFTYAKSTSDLAPSSMHDVVTGSDSQRVIRGTLGTLSMFGPYGSDRFMSLFRFKLETLTIQYRDADGGLHGVIFTTPVGTADVIKNELVALAAHTSITTQGDLITNTSDPSNTKELVSNTQGGPPSKINASAITVMMIQSDEIKLPLEFQVSLYENLIQQLEKEGGFQHVYREGDRHSAGAPNLIVLHSSVRGFKKGSEMARQVGFKISARLESCRIEWLRPQMGQARRSIRLRKGDKNRLFAKSYESISPTCHPIPVVDFASFMKRIW